MRAFKPEDIGFRYDPDYSVIGATKNLLDMFASRIPVGKLSDWVAGIFLDADCFYQLQEEIRRMNLRPESSEIAASELFGFPITLAGVDGISLSLKPAAAPWLLKKQIEGHQRMLAQQQLMAREIADAVKDGRVVALEPAEEKKPDKSEMH